MYIIVFAPLVSLNSYKGGELIMAQLQPDMDTVAIYGFYMAMTEGVSKAFVVDMVPPEKR